MREQQLSDAPAPEAPRQAAETPEQTTRGAFAGEGTWRRWCWLRHWEFWLALALGAFLRLWQIGTTQFLDDQTGLYALARAGVLHHVIPLTGIPSSIQSLNPPLSVYLLMPFAAITPNPLPAVVTLALWNVAGVALCYIFALRYFGRRVAAVGTLLFATGGSALNFSRFLWQQNYLPPLLVLWAFTLYLGAVRGKRPWLAGNILLLVLAVQLHPTAVLLAPVTLAGILLAPRLPRVREYVIAAIGTLLLFVPTAIFEWNSRGYDLHKLGHYLLHGGRFNLDVFRVLWGALDGPGSADLGPTTPYANVHRWYFFITWCVVILVITGWAVLTVRVVAPVLAIWRSVAPDPARLPRRLMNGAIAVWRGVRADSTWRAQFLLWFWVTLPPATMLHNAGRIFTHYLLVIFPSLFIAGGFGVDWLLTRFAIRPIHHTHPAALRQRIVPALALVVIVVAVAGEGARMFLYPTTLATGNFLAYYTYGYPLDEMLTLDGQLTTLNGSKAPPRRTSLRR
ncbi:MAG TPA: hypothetical protein VKQ30_25250 [Ktedonobacterales bacterium]|nr:hypothetical protein [Ktedonobacterales bacterium]